MEMDSLSTERETRLLIELLPHYDLKSVPCAAFSQWKLEGYLCNGIKFVFSFSRVKTGGGSEQEEGKHGGTRT